jgi:hypothetical protein
LQAEVHEVDVRDRERDVSLNHDSSLEQAVEQIDQSDFSARVAGARRFSTRVA